MRGQGYSTLSINQVSKLLLNNKPLQILHNDCFEMSQYKPYNIIL
jgi:hypothetical protein